MCRHFWNLAVWRVFQLCNYIRDYRTKISQGLEMLRFALYSDGAGLWVKSQIALGKIKGRGGSVQLRAGLGWLVSLRGDSKNRTCLWPSGLFGLVHKCLGGWFHLYQHYLTLCVSVKLENSSEFSTNQAISNEFPLGWFSVSGTGRGCIDLARVE